MSKDRVFVAEDNADFLEKLVSLLEAEFAVVGTAQDGKSAVELVRECKPDLLVLDINMPGLSGIEVAREIANDRAGPRVVICSVETDPEIVEVAQRAGALGYVFKARVERDLIVAARAALECQVFVSQQQ